MGSYFIFPVRDKAAKKKDYKNRKNLKMLQLYSKESGVSPVFNTLLKSALITFDMINPMVGATQHSPM